MLPLALLLVLAQVSQNRRALDIALVVWLAGVLALLFDLVLLAVQGRPSRPGRAPGRGAHPWARRLRAAALDRVPPVARPGCARVARASHDGLRALGTVARVRRRALLLALVAASAAACSATRPVALEAPVSATTRPPSTAPSPSPPPPAPELPRGGRSIFPRHFVVMAYGTAGTGALGVLGEAPPDEAARRLEAGAVQWAKASGRPVLPAFELITSVAQRAPGPDGRYSVGLAHSEVQRYLDAARRAKMLLVLDFQPGRADVLDQVKHYARFLAEPEVGVALDPEWALEPGERPGRQIGSLPASDVNAVSAYLSDVVRRNRLPEKVFMVHQFKQYMLPDRELIADRFGLATVFHVDGFGPRHSKAETYALLSSKDGVIPGGRVHNGYKLFLDEDVPLQDAAEVLAITPRPELVSYQ